MNEAVSTPNQIDCGGHSAGAAGGEENHDRFLIGHLSKSMLVPQSNTTFGSRSRLFGRSQAHLLLVADGLDSPAAETVVETLAQQLLEAVPWFFGLDVGREHQLKTQLEHVVDRCHASIAAIPGGPSAESISGTTLTAAYILWPRMHLMHLGDSRCYLIRGSEARRLTTDHVRRVRTARAGASPLSKIPPGQPGTGTSVLTNALGAGIRSPAVDFATEQLQVGDTVVLCTAGLSAVVDDERLLRGVDGARSAADAAEKLVAAARQLDASEDATAVVARFTRRRSMET